MAAVESGETVSTDVLTFDALHLALTRCMTAHPPGGIEFQMHSDANVMAGLWGLMNYERTLSVPLEEVKPEVLEVFRRWGPDFPEGQPK